MEEQQLNMESHLDTSKSDPADMIEAVRLLEDDIRRTKISIEGNEQMILECSRDIHNIRLRATLLNGRSIDFKKKTLICNELNQRIKQNTNSLDKTSGINEGKTLYSSQSRTYKERSGEKRSLESQCNRDVSSACEQIKYLRRNNLTDREFNTQKSDGALETLRDQLWKHVKELLGNSKTRDVLGSVCHNAKISTTALVTKTNAIDLAKDAEDLRFKFESGKLQDVSEEPVLLQSVDQIIEEGQDAHFQRFFEAEKAKNDSWREKKRLKKTQHRMNGLLEKKYGKNRRELNLIRRIFDLENELYGIQASTAYFKELIDDMKGARTKKQKTEESLQMKYRFIQQFETDAQYKQSVIQHLVKQNGGAKMRLEEQRNELLGYLKKYFGSMGKEMLSIVATIEEELGLEIELFHEMKILLLKASEYDSCLNIPFEDLSIHRLEGSVRNCLKAAADSALDAVIGGLNFPSYLAPEYLLSEIREFKDQEFDVVATSRLSLLCGLINSGFLNKKLKKLEDLCIELIGSNKKDEYQVIPSLRETLSIGTEAMRDCLTLENLVNIWWDQPAQFTIPWLREDGMNLNQWHTQWANNSTRLVRY